MESLIVYSYHGFGDHCVVYGIIKEYAKLHDKILYYTDIVDANYLRTRKRLYSSIKNVQIMDEPYNREKHGLNLGIAHMQYWFDAVKPWYDDPNLPVPDWYSEDWSFDKVWYKQANIDFNLKWDNFYFERDLNKEKELYYDILGLKDDEEFIFLHEDPKRNFLINRKYINPNIKLFEMSKYGDRNTFDILDILYTVEKAKEVHTFGTCSLTYIDLMNIKRDKLYYHRYIRPMLFELPTLRLNWNIID